MLSPSGAGLRKRQTFFSRNFAWISLQFFLSHLALQFYIAVKFELQRVQGFRMTVYERERQGLLKGAICGMYVIMSVKTL